MRGSAVAVFWLSSPLMMSFAAATAQVSPLPSALDEPMRHAHRELATTTVAVNACWNGFQVKTVTLTSDEATSTVTADFEATGYSSMCSTSCPNCIWLNYVGLQSVSSSCDDATIPDYVQNSRLTCGGGYRNSYSTYSITFTSVPAGTYFLAFHAWPVYVQDAHPELGVPVWKDRPHLLHPFFVWQVL